MSAISLQLTELVSYISLATCLQVGSKADRRHPLRAGHEPLGAAREGALRQNSICRIAHGENRRIVPASTNIEVGREHQSRSLRRVDILQPGVEALDPPHVGCSERWVILVPAEERYPLALSPCATPAEAVPKVINW